jgi:5-aminopentanamidase
MRVGLFQNHPRFGAVEENVQRVVEELSSVRADLIVLPELFNTGYQFTSMEEAVRLAEEVPQGKTSRALLSLARSAGMFLVFGLAEKEGVRLFNSAVLVGPEGFVGRYRKAHLFAEEKDFFEPGDTGFQVFDLGPARVGIMVCFDWLFPESARALSLMGADILCHPSNLVLSHCQEVMRTRSLENGVFSITANRTGMEARGGREPLRFTGKSQILDCRGNLLTAMGEEDTGVLLTDIDPGESRNKAITPRNDRFGDRRPELYDALTVR